mgnify:CR=1 FL=1
MEGQMSFFDIAPEEEKDNFHITFPDVGEYDKQTLLAFEKETIGIYVSGHPMEEYRGTLGEKCDGENFRFRCG